MFVSIKPPTRFGLFSRPSSGGPPLCFVPLPFLTLICVRWVCIITQYVAACVYHLCVFGVLAYWWSACELVCLSAHIALSHANCNVSAFHIRTLVSFYNFYSMINALQTLLINYLHFLWRPSLRNVLLSRIELHWVLPSSPHSPLPNHWFSSQ